ncbi:MAG: hypothetical protein LBE06_03295 [Azoarcus sp.]|jgi:hypothetical protein|nr:hypothetical protein [Azoarcus sp.]
MVSSGDWIPHREDALANLVAVWQTRLANAASQTAYGWVAAECTTTVATLTAFMTARAAYQGTRTKGNHDLKEEARKAAIAAMRKFANERIRFNAKMNTSQREELGVFPRDPEPTPVPVPRDGPGSRTKISSLAPGKVEVEYLKARPRGIIAVEIAFGALDAPVESAEDLPHRDAFTRNPWVYTCAHGERGKKLFYALRYRGNEGVSAWSDIRDVIIP